MNRKMILCGALALLAAFQPLRADEGMWLPVLISQRIEDMQARILKWVALSSSRGSS